MNIILKHCQKVSYLSSSLHEIVRLEHYLTMTEKMMSGKNAEYIKKKNKKGLLLKLREIKLTVLLFVRLCDLGNVFIYLLLTWSYIREIGIALFI